MRRVDSRIDRKNRYKLYFIPFLKYRYIKIMLDNTMHFLLLLTVDSWIDPTTFTIVFNVIFYVMQYIYVIQIALYHSYNLRKNNIFVIKISKSCTILYNFFFFCTYSGKVFLIYTNKNRKTQLNPNFKIKNIKNRHSKRQT